MKQVQFTVIITGEIADEEDESELFVNFELNRVEIQKFRKPPRTHRSKVRNIQCVAGVDTIHSQLHEYTTVDVEKI